VLAGIIGSLQALEAMKVVTGVGTPLRDRLLTYQALHNSFYEIAISPSEKWSGPADARAFRRWPYGDGCGVTAAAEGEAYPPPFTPLDAAGFDALLYRKDILIIDVREVGEEPFIDHFTHIQWPLSRLRKTDPGYSDQTIVVFCQSGKRSLEAAAILANRNRVYQLEHGILDWLAHQ